MAHLRIYTELPPVSVKRTERETLYLVPRLRLCGATLPYAYSLVLNLAKFSGFIIPSNRLHDCFLVSKCTPLTANYKMLDQNKILSDWAHDNNELSSASEIHSASHINKLPLPAPNPRLL
jgi:hypothetical protein